VRKSGLQARQRLEDSLLICPEKLLCFDYTSQNALFKMSFRQNVDFDFSFEEKTFEVSASKETGDEGLFNYSAESEFFYFFIKNLTAKKAREIIMWMGCIPTLLADSARKRDSNRRFLQLWKIRGSLKNEQICKDLIEIVEENYCHEVNIFQKLRIVNHALSMLKMVGETPNILFGFQKRHCVLDETLSFLFMSEMLRHK